MKLNTVLAVSLLVAVGVGFNSGCHHHHHHSGHHDGGRPIYVVPSGHGHHHAPPRPVNMHGPHGGKPATPARKPALASPSKHPGSPAHRQPGGFSHRPTSTGIARPASGGKPAPKPTGPKPAPVKK